MTVRCAEVMESGSSDDICLSFVDTEVCGRERGTYVENKRPVSRWIKISENFADLYMLLSLPLVIESLSVCER